MTRTPVACTLAVAAALVVSACGSGASAGRKSVDVRYASLRQAAAAAAAALSHHCTRDVTSSDSNGLLWLVGGPRPLVYYASPDGDPPDKVLTTSGSAIPPWGLLWPCRPPVVIHYPKTHTASGSSAALLTVLASKPSERRTITLGQARFANVENRNSLSGYANALAAPNGRIVFFGGTKIRYANGPEFSVRGLPQGWQIGALAVSPRNPFVFLAIAKKGELGSQPCASAVYRITRTSSSRLRSYSGCQAGVMVQWSPDGRHIAWFTPAGLGVSDASGRPVRPLVRRLRSSTAWSPDSTEIAYGFNHRGIHWTGVVDVSTGARHVVGKGYPLAWSPDGKEVALIRQGTVLPLPAGSIVAVPASGGRAHLLFKIPAAPSS
jgi:hypothetical protein